MSAHKTHMIGPAVYNHKGSTQVYIHVLHVCTPCNNYKGRNLGIFLKWMKCGFTNARNVALKGKNAIK